MTLSIFNDIRKAGRNAPHSDVSLLLDMVRNGDVHHGEGGFIAALDALATVGKCAFAGAVIYRTNNFTFRCQRGDMITEEETAKGALLEALRVERHDTERLHIYGWVEAQQEAAA